MFSTSVWVRDFICARNLICMLCIFNCDIQVLMLVDSEPRSIINENALCLFIHLHFNEYQGLTLDKGQSEMLGTCRRGTWLE
ncbi:hypothetical protein RJT34_19537 [Clitoria ternatea]|uniref:Uncharacterized protein n=1 Tax=Clitoria ternatea TaxID=43366 RepID=A0AAN9IRN2_CLITE